MLKIRDMFVGIYIIFLLDTIPSSPAPKPNPIDSINININLEEGNNGKISHKSASDYVENYKYGSYKRYGPLKEYGSFKIHGRKENYKKRSSKRYGRTVKVDPAKFAGRWAAEIIGIKLEFTVNRNGKVSVDERTYFLQQSDNQVDFPSSEGWMKTTKLLRNTTWDYSRMVEDDKMEIHHFCSDNCHEKYNNLQDYCCTGFAVRKDANVKLKMQMCDSETCRADSCFPGTSMVMLDGGEKRCMEELRIGDKIMTVENGNLKPTTVLGFLDKKVNQTAYYINLTLKDNRSLLISSRHVMFIKGDNNIIQSILAMDVSLGDIVIVNDGEKVVFAPIRNITVELKMGAYVPLTHAGTLLVDGVLVSSYTNVDHWLAHIALSPLRWWPTLLLDTERSQNLEGLRIFPRMMRNLGSILGFVTMADGKMETVENPVLGMSQLAMEKLDKTEF